MFAVDSHEPLNIEALLRPAIPDLIRSNLNSIGYADYLWTGYGTLIEQVERKTVGEVLSGFEHVEAQLLSQVNGSARPRLANQILLVEGVVAPSAKEPNQTVTYQLASNGSSYRVLHSYKMPYTRYVSWLVSLERAGILVWHTHDWIGTAHALIQLYKAAQRADQTSTALRRHLKDKPVWTPDPGVQTLMGIQGAKLGPVLAEALIAHYKTPWAVLSASPQDIAQNVKGVGLQRAQQIIRAIGRVV